MTVTHVAGPVVEGGQRCSRCGTDLRAAPDGIGWEPGSDVVEERFADGVHLSAVVGDGAAPCRSDPGS